MNSWTYLRDDDLSLALPADLREKDAAAAIDCGWVNQMRPFILHYSQPDDLIVDPFAGWGTTLVAAVAEGRRALGIELEPSRANIINTRLQRLNFANQAQVICADAASVELPSESAALCLSSIPYFGAWLNRDWNLSPTNQLYQKQTYTAYLELMDKIIARMKSVLRENGLLILMAENLHVPEFGFIPLAWDIGKLISKHYQLLEERIICYDKPATSPADALRTNRAHEYVLLGKKVSKNVH